MDTEAPQTRAVAPSVRCAALTRFLLDRLDEEEAAMSAAAGPAGGRLGPADLEGRRVIIAGCRRLDDTLDTYGVPAPFDGDEILRWLALPYAGHAAYRAEWAPER